jgi:hypothetical protein
MGVSTTVLGFIQEALFVYRPNLRFEGQEMCELGDQTLQLKSYLSHGNGRYLAKEYFEALGFKHVSIDIHGKHGSVALDLSKPIDKWQGRFDVLTNLGTSEHVDDQYECWKNIHNLVKKGGIFISIMPFTQWEIDRNTLEKTIHCKYFYMPEFIRSLCISNTYCPYMIKLILNQGVVAYAYRKMHDNKFQTSKEEIEKWVSKI